MREVSERVGAPLASVALAWVLGQRGVTSLLVGARNPEELAWNLPALELELDGATVAELERLTEPVKEAIGRNLDMWMAESRMR
jgi:aryl-alcohol dehydrogenase-like predicted oxidoreductase